MCLTSCNTFQKHLLSQKENLIFWPQKWIFEISEAIFDSFWHPNMRKRHCKATLKVSKKILRPSIKNRLDTFVPNVLGINLIPFSWSYDQNWLRETLKTEKRQKLLWSEPFEIIGFKWWFDQQKVNILIIHQNVQNLTADPNLVNKWWFGQQKFNNKSTNMDLHIIHQNVRIWRRIRI